MFQSLYKIITSNQKHLILVVFKFFNTYLMALNFV